MDELTHNVSEWGGVSVPTTLKASILMVEAGWNGHGGLLQN